MELATYIGDARGVPVLVRSQQALFAFEPESGQMMWSVDTGHSDSLQTVVLCSEGLIVVGGASLQTIGLNGEPKWKRILPGGQTDSIQVSDRTIACVSRGRTDHPGTLSVLDLRDGTIRWSQSLQDGFGSPVYSSEFMVLPRDGGFFHLRLSVEKSELLDEPVRFIRAHLGARGQLVLLQRDRCALFDLAMRRYRWSSPLLQGIPVWHSLRLVEEHLFLLETSRAGNSARWIRLSDGASCASELERGSVRVALCRDVGDSCYLVTMKGAPAETGDDGIEVLRFVAGYPESMWSCRWGQRPPFVVHDLIRADQRLHVCLSRGLVGDWADPNDSRITSHVGVLVLEPMDGSLIGLAEWEDDFAGNPRFGRHCDGTMILLGPSVRFVKH